MNSGLKKYKNTKFDRVTAALRTALRQIRADPRLPLTVTQVADMANCSRELLYTPKRKWVVRRIERIALARALLDKTTEPKNADSRKDEGGLEKMLQTMRHDNASLFHEKRALLNELQTVRDENKELSRDLKSCEEQLYALREEVRRMVTPSVVRRRR
jgi:chromosome segregation ATPase